MTEYPVQCYNNNGEPYGIYITDFESEDWATVQLIKEWEVFAEANTFPLPSGTIGKTYEREDLEVVYQLKLKYPASSYWVDKPKEEFDKVRNNSSWYHKRQIFRLTSQPVDHSKTSESCQQTTLLTENDRQDQPVEKEPETVEQAAEKLHVRLLEGCYSILDVDVYGIINKAFKSGVDWQKQQSN